MKARSFFAIICLSLIVVLNAMAEVPLQPVRDNTVRHAGNVLAKAAVDTTAVMGAAGSGAPYFGDFEAGWNGWTSVDYTHPQTNHWHVSNYNQAVVSNLAAWCGTLDYAVCAGTDTLGGYGNNWRDPLEIRLPVADPDSSASIHLTGTLQYDTEPGLDYVYLVMWVEDSDYYVEIQRWHGKGTANFDETFTYLPGEFVGGSEVQVQFLVYSDGGWSDEDCNWRTAGACQLDDVSVTLSQTGQTDLSTFDDFQDGTLGNWSNPFALGVGDFAQLWTGLEELDYCATNYTQQVGFIDDGLVVPGTGGTMCLTWCYGPNGYIVNHDGGLQNSVYRLDNAVLSPVMNWPDVGKDGISFSFDVYRHETLSIDSPGIFYNWGVRSADTDNSAGNGIQALIDQPFVSRGYVYWGGPDYVRETYFLSDLMVAGRDEFQVQLGVYQLGWTYGFNGVDGTPAPYFDNVAVKIFPLDGPVMTVKIEDLAQDSFPESDVLDYVDLGSMSVRFDAARNIATTGDLRIDPGDTVVVRIRAMRAGSSLFMAPEMHYTVKANSLFDPYRTVAISGVVIGVPAVGATGVPSPELWAFDLPDTGLLYPGDILHYYFRAGDDVLGDIRYTTLPEDITGYGDFSNPQAYDTDFVVHALPTIVDNGYGGYGSPTVLFWDDAGSLVAQDSWFGALEDMGMVEGLDYDVFHTNAPSSGVGNGLGSRTDGASLAPYDIMLYSAGDLGAYTLTNGDFTKDGSNDVATVMSWLSTGDKGMFLTGDNVASDLSVNVGLSGVAFTEAVMGVDVVNYNIRPLIANQATPIVMPMVGNQVLFLNEWVAYGGCASINTFDAVTARAGAERLAEFTEPNGQTGATVYSAATANTFAGTSKVVSLPYDLSYIFTTPAGQLPGGYTSRSTVLRDAMVYLGYHEGYCITGPCSGVPEAGTFGVRSYPNPFNPKIRLDYTIKAAGHLSLKVFDIRGRLVRTLVDETVQTSGFVLWDGTDSKGARVASGVYFREARMGQEVLVEKMALIK